MSPIVTETVAERVWTMVVDATTSPPRAVTVGRDGSVSPDRPARRVDVSSPDGPVETADEVALALSPVVGDGEPPVSTVMIVTADTTRRRFGLLAEGSGLAGLPAPTWVPDAVAVAGTVLADGGDDRPCLVIDARADDIQAWGLRPSLAAGRVGTVAPVEITGSVEDLLIGIVRAKLGESVPPPAELSTSSSDGPDLGLRRAAAQLRRDLRDAARRLAAEGTGHSQIVVTVDDVEATIESRELAEAVGHAAREGMVGAYGADGAEARAVVIAGRERGLARHLATSIDAAIVSDGAPTALDGAAALVRPRPSSPQGPASTDRPVPVADGSSDGPGSTGRSLRPLAPFRPPTSRPPAAGSSLGAPVDAVPLPAPDVVRAPESVRDRPRWAVPALSSLVAAALVAAGATLVTDATTSHALGPAAVVPTDAAPAAVLPGRG